MQLSKVGWVTTTSELFTHKYTLIKHTKSRALKYTLILHTIKTNLINLVILYNGNCLQNKKFANFANMEAFANVFLHFLSRLEFLYNEIP